MSLRRRNLALLVTLSALAAATSAAGADCSISITPKNGTSLGKIVGPPSVGGLATTFTIPTGSGAVTQSPAASSAGAAILLHPPSNFQWEVEIKAGGNCNNTISVTVLATSSKFSFPGTATFTLAKVNGIQNSLPATLNNSGGSFPLSFSSSGSNGDAIFDIGTSIILPANAAGGTASWTTTVTAQ
ncbi:hypothetical protein ACO2Q3_00580 [Caulobacter sp. KR2-114]|uniref:hypothetical protein n=1 Tax=Caulobacter sp. KR2-114 TaxID=3400912 RepID=UPI003C0FE549